MNGTLTRKRLLIGASALLAALLLVGGTAWVAWPQGTDTKFGIDLNLPKLDESHPDGFWFPVVVNDSGRTVPEAKLDVSVVTDGSDSPLRIADSRDEAREKYGDFAPDTDEKCRVPAEDDFDESAAELTYMQYSASAGCEKDLEPGNNTYSLWLGAADAAAEAFADGESVSVTIQATLTIEGETVATTTEKLPLKHDPARHNLTVEGIPDLVTSDRTTADPHSGKLTIANDTKKDLTGGVLTVVADPYSGIGLESARDTCQPVDTDSGHPTSLACSGIDIPAGKSIVVKLDVYANPGGFDEEKMTNQKLYFKVGKKTGADDFAKKSRQIWLETR